MPKCSYIVEAVSSKLAYKPHGNDEPEHVILYAQEFSDRGEAMAACDAMFRHGGAESAIVRDADYDPIYVNTTSNRRVR